MFIRPAVLAKRKMGANIVVMQTRILLQID
jgi:hypothetical protein